MRWPRRTTVVAVWLVQAAVLVGCSLVDEPDPAEWDAQAGKALQDAASEVRTTRLALDTAADERSWSSYTTVLVVQAEDGVATVADDLAVVQVPPGRQQRADEVERLIEGAVAAVREARSLALRGTYDDPDVVDQLDRLAGDLEQAAGQG